MIPSLEVWPTKAKEAVSPHEVRLTPLDTNPVFLCLGANSNFYVSGLSCQKTFKISRAVVRETPKMLSATEIISASTVNILVVEQDRIRKRE